MSEAQCVKLDDVCRVKGGSGIVSDRRLLRQMRCVPVLAEVSTFSHLSLLILPVAFVLMIPHDNLLLAPHNSIPKPVSLKFHLKGNSL